MVDEGRRGLWIWDWILADNTKGFAYLVSRAGFADGLVRAAKILCIASARTWPRGAE